MRISFSTYFVTSCSSSQENVSCRKDDANRPPDAMKSFGGPLLKNPQIRNTRWADGLRGVAAVGVMSSHMALSFARQLISPCHEGRDGPMYLFQRPFLRLVVQGQSFVALFFILMGFVNSLKPLKQAQGHQFEDALLTLAKSSLNRTARLVLPATAVTIIAWIACQLHLFEVARRSEAYWLQVNSFPPSGSLGNALEHLWTRGLLQTWTWGDNVYDQPQWALRYLLMGSMSIFLVLLITILMRPSVRALALVLLYAYGWITGDFLVSTNIYFGVLLAQIHTSNLINPSKSFLWRWTPLLTSIVGLYLMSFPSEYAQDALWSRQLDDFGHRLVPGHAEVSRFWPGIGAQILCASILCSPTLQKILSGRFLAYLGGVSFSLYLLHGTLMRTVLAYMVFGPAILSRRELIDGWWYPMPDSAYFLFILPVFLVFMMAAVHIWSVKVEPVFAMATKKLEELATGGKEGRRSPIMVPVGGNGRPRKPSKADPGHVRVTSNGSLEKYGNGEAIGLHGPGHRRTSSNGHTFGYQNGHAK